MSLKDSLRMRTTKPRAGKSKGFYATIEPYLFLLPAFTIFALFCFTPSVAPSI